eukprot:TRINITY_DN25752_c0_g1_i2.p1 TRINITY_DN25752_c0_g1~~TRINITY_DN25752_c0_g1_i2.p1  ORF type:complete len:358 (-),score=61.51 TRINITY_DN25752_c0_g1_i2:61-1134(-)
MVAGGTKPSQSDGHRLSHITEGRRVSETLYFSVCGQSSVELTNRMVAAIEEEYPALAPAQSGPCRSASRRSRGSVSSLHSGTAGMNSSGSLVGDHLYTMSCRFWVTGNEASFPSYGNMFPSETSCEEERASKDKTLVQAYFCPVEKFSDEIPPINSINRWKQSASLFLLDKRQDDGRLMADLRFRRDELQRSVKDFAKRRELEGVPPLFALVLVHSDAPASSQTSPKAESKMNVSVLPGCTSEQSNGSEDTAMYRKKSIKSATISGASLDDESADFVGSVQGIASPDPRQNQVVPKELTHLSLNFDDDSALARAMVTLAAEIVERRRDDYLLPFVLQGFSQAKGNKLKFSQPCCVAS